MKKAAAIADKPDATVDDEQHYPTVFQGEVTNKMSGKQGHG